MFELEDFDLDDEIFLMTQMPTVADSAPPTPSSSDSNCVASNFEENRRTFPGVSNAVLELDHSSTRNADMQNTLPEKQSLNNLDKHTFDSVPKVEHKSEITKPINECQATKNKINFDDCFDSDHEAFFNTPDILDEPINSSRLNNSTVQFNYKTNHNESFSSFKFKRCESVLNSSKTENFTNKLNYNNLLNTTVTSVKTKTPKCSSRKFPGPAGLLTENEDLSLEDPSNLESLDISINLTENDKNKENLCTQANDSSFTSSPYQQFLSDFSTTGIDTLLDKYNVAWIKQKLLPYTASGRSYTDKIPFFVSVVKEIDCLSPDPTVVLADKTGHIRGTIHRAVWNQFSSQLKLGSVLVLSKVGVSCQKIVKGFTLNITSDHLVAIYSISLEDVQEVIVTRTTDLSNEEIVNDAKCWNVFNAEILNKSPHSEIRSRMIALHNLKLRNSELDESSQHSSANSQASKTTPIRSTPVKSFFKPKTPIAQNLFKIGSYGLPEEPPAKRLRNEEHKSKTEQMYSNNEMSIIENIFEGINEEEIFNDFCC